MPVESVMSWMSGITPKLCLAGVYLEEAVQWCQWGSDFTDVSGAEKSVKSVMYSCQSYQ